MVSLQSISTVDYICKNKCSLFFFESVKIFEAVSKLALLASKANLLRIINLLRIPFSSRYSGLKFQLIYTNIE
jgi:hypothetical protein